MKSIKQEKFPHKSGQMGKAYPLSVRTAALRDYLSGMFRNAVALKYSLPDASLLSYWKRKFATSEDLKASTKMVKRRNKRLLLTDMESAQSARIKELERALYSCQKSLSEKDQELKKTTLALLIKDTMIDLAEEEFGVDIRKNFGSK